MTSEVAFFLAGQSADALKAEKPGPVLSVDEIPGRSEVGSSSQPAVHSNQFPGHPPPLLLTHCPIINTKLSQLGSVSSRFLNVYPYLNSREHFYTENIHI